MKSALSSALEKQKQALYQEKTEDEAKPLIGQLWEILVILMIAYFLVSIIHSLVQNYLKEEDMNKKKRD